MRRIACVCLLLAHVARAEAQDDFGARATVDRPGVTASHGEDATASGTSLDLVDRVTVPRSLGDVVREAPGARVLNTGALGAFSSVSLRGADGEEAVVMLDEIPLVTPDGGAFDLSLFAPVLFERIDVFRGGAPVWLGSGAIGGVLRLVPRRPDQRASQVSLGGGSFGSYELQGGASVRSPADLRVSSQAVVRGARNDYPYDDDKGTLFDPSDDEELRRQNAQITDASGLFDLSVPVPGGRLHVLTLGQSRTAGFPGPGADPTPNIHRQSARALGAVSYEGKAGGRSLRRRYQLLASTAYNLDRYTDRYGELGARRPQDTDDQGYRLFLRAAGSLRFRPWLEGTLVSSYALDRADREDALSFPKPAPSTRHTGALGMELAARGQLGPVLLELRPSARLEGSATTLHADQATSGSFDNTRNVLAPTARLGGALEPVRGVALSASVATGTRLPTMFELFGDRGLVLPAPGLEPVKSTTYDGGITLRGARRAWSGMLEAHAFHQEKRDAIVGTRTSQFQVKHDNVSEVSQRGAELGLSGRFARLLAVHGSATVLDAQNALDKRLPFRPRWVLYGRPEATFALDSPAVSSVSLASELWYRSFVYTDSVELGYVPECFTAALTGALSFWQERVRLSGRMEDVADARCSDLVGYPLPGRSLFFTVSVRE